MTAKEESSPAGRPLRVLLVEDNPRDAKLIIAVLERSGYQLSVDTVTSLASFQEQLERSDHEVILADYNLRGWTALEALQALKNSGRDIPFVVVTGTLGDEAAVEVIQQGATDYVLKDRLARLPSAIERALEEKTFREERKESEKALRKSEAAFRGLFEAAPDAIVLVNEDGRITLVNAQAESVFGYTREELIGQPMEMLLPERFRERHIGHRPAYQANPTIRRMGVGLELFALRKDGVEIPVEVGLSSLQTNEGARVLSIIRDVSERKQLELQFFQAQKMEAIGRLAGGVAHDFNNHLGIIIGYSELLLERLGANDPLRKNAGMIKEAGLRSASLTRQLLAFSRRQIFEPRILDLNEVVSELEKMLRPLIGEDIELVTSLDPVLGKVRGDSTQMEQVIMNLAANARDAMPQGGRLTIETTNVDLDEAYAKAHVTAHAGPHVMLAVSDTGMGMAPETLAHIYEPFFTTKEKSKGTGLGLAMVYGIVKQSGGWIWVYSEPGHGTTFKIYLPRVEAGIREAEAEVASPVSLKGEETILVVEDEAMLRELACEFLQSSGYTVLEAANGAEAIEISKRHQGPIHLLMTDAVMPGMSGRELAQRLVGARPDMKVLYVSGYTDDVVLRNGLLEPDRAFLQKPFTKDALTNKVRAVLEGGKGATGDS